MSILQLEHKNKLLEDILLQMGKVLVAFSGGVDSTFLLAKARDVLGKENVVALTANSETFPDREVNEANQLIQLIDVDHKIIQIHELENKDFVENSHLRCYHCKSDLFTKIKNYAADLGFLNVIDGTNASDASDFRPGMKALQELGINSPLKEAGLTKEDIRTLSKDMNLPTWDKPSFACLSSRIPYGTKITQDKIDQLDACENYLYQLGLRQFRVRHHDNIARIETDEEGFGFVIQSRHEIEKTFKEYGFAYITLDLTGYRTGSMNIAVT